MFLDIIIIYVFALMQPGPSFLIICNNTILYGRFSGFITSIAIILGVALQSGIVIFFANILKENQNIFNVLKLFGAVSLIIIGLKIIYNNKKLINLNKRTLQGHFIYAFLVEFCNPIAFSFFISIFSQIIEDNNNIINFYYWLIICLLAAIWFTFLVFIASNKLIFDKLQILFKKLAFFIGIIFIFYGCKFLFLN